MARFRAFIRGRYGNKASRLGDEVSGILAELTTHSVGVTVSGRVTVDGDDAFDVFITKGKDVNSTEDPLLHFIGRVTIQDDRPTFETVMGGIIR